MPIANVPPRALQTLRILWFALTASTVLLFVVLGRVERPKTQPDPTMAMALAVVALGVLGVSIVLPRKQMLIAAGFRERSPLPVIHTAFILGMALTESVALFGFVLGFQNFATTIYVPFFAVAWIVFVLRFPRPTHPLGVLGPPFTRGDG